MLQTVVLSFVIISDYNLMIMAKPCHQIYYDPEIFNGLRKFVLFLFLFFLFLFCLFLLFLANCLSFFTFLCFDFFDLNLHVLDIWLLRSDHDLLLLDLRFHIVLEGCHLGLELLECFNVYESCVYVFDHTLKFI